MHRKSYLLFVVALLIAVSTSVGVVQFNGKKFLKVTVMQEDGTITASFFPSFDDVDTVQKMPESGPRSLEDDSEIQQSKKEVLPESKKEEYINIPSPQNRHKIHKSKGSAKKEKYPRSYSQSSDISSNQRNDRYKEEEDTPLNGSVQPSKIELQTEKIENRNLRGSQGSTNIGEEHNDIIGQHNRIYGKQNLIRGNINYVTEKSYKNQIHGDGNHVDGYGNIIYSY